MRWWTALLFTLALAVVGLALTFTLSFPVIWVVSTGCALWAFWDSDRIGVRQYASIFGLGPIFVFASILLLWVVFFPIYLVVRGRIKAGAQARKAPPDQGLRDERTAV